MDKRATPIADLQAVGRYWIAGKVADAALVRAAVARIRDDRLREEVEKFLAGRGSFPGREALAALEERLLEVLAMTQGAH